MILLTAAGGTTGSALLRHLLARGLRVRALTTRESTAARLREAGAEPFLGDLRDPASLRRAMQGVETVHLIVPPMQADEYDIGCSVIEAARASGVGRITYHSVVHPHTPDVSFHFEKCRVQIALLECGLPYTLLQATNYMQNLHWVWPQLLRTGEFPMPYSAEQPVTWIDLEDLAEAAARVVAEPGHEYATYELVGTAPLPRTELAAILSRVLGRPVRAVRLDPDGAFERLARFTPEEQGRVRTMYRHYDRYGFRAGHPRMLGLLLGREPTSYEAFARRFVREQGS